MSWTTEGREREEWECLRRVEGEWEQVNRHKCAGDGGRRHASDSRARCRATPPLETFSYFSLARFAPMSSDLVVPGQPILLPRAPVPQLGSGIYSRDGLVRASLVGVPSYEGSVRALLNSCLAT